MKIALVLFLLGIVPALVSGANILGLMSMASPSHHNWNRHIFYELVERGHNLTVLSADVDQEMMPGLHYIWAEAVYSTLYNRTQGNNLLDTTEYEPYKGSDMYYNFFKINCEGFMKSNGFQTLLNYPDDFKFDVILIDYTIEPCLIGFLAKFSNTPTVGLSATSIPHYTYEYVAGQDQPSFVPHIQASFNSNMSFIERLDNIKAYLYDRMQRKYSFIPHQETVMRKGFKNDKLPNYETLSKNVALVLTNYHFSLEKRELLPPNVIPVAGVHIQEPKPLDSDLEDFVQSAKNGVVLVSLGTNIKSVDLNDERKQVFIETFKRFPEYNFIWKYESDLEFSLPKNAKTLGWVSQNDVLGHPRTKAFISHCGLLSIQEAIWHGVPIVGLPFFGDQHRNVRTGLQSGTMVKVDYTTLDVDTLFSALLEVLKNPTYQINVQKQSTLFRDQLEKPIDRAVFWIEWAIRHKDDYSSIQLPLKHLGVVVIYNLDIVAYLAGIIIVSLGILVCIILYCKGKKLSNKVKQH